jgi:hypothetical protein
MTRGQVPWNAILYRGTRVFIVGVAYVSSQAKCLSHPFTVTESKWSLWTNWRRLYTPLSGTDLFLWLLSIIVISRGSPDVKSEPLWTRQYSMFTMKLRGVESVLSQGWCKSLSDLGFPRVRRPTRVCTRHPSLCPVTHSNLSASMSTSLKSCRILYTRVFTFTDASLRVVSAISWIGDYGVVP